MLAELGDRKRLKTEKTAEPDLLAKVREHIDTSDADPFANSDRCKNLEKMCTVLRQPVVEEQAHEALQIVTRWMSPPSRNIDLIWKTLLPTRLVGLLALSVKSPLLVITLEILRKVSDHCWDCCQKLVKLNVNQRMGKLGKRIWREFDSNYIHTEIFRKLLLLCCSITKHSLPVESFKFFCPIMELLKPVGNGKLASEYVRGKACLLLRNLLIHFRITSKDLRLMRRHKVFIFLANCIKYDSNNRKRALVIVGKIGGEKYWLLLHLLRNGLCEGLSSALVDRDYDYTSLVLKITKHILVFKNDTLKCLAAERVFLLTLSDLMYSSCSRQVRATVLRRLVDLLCFDVENRLPMICYTETIWYASLELKRARYSETKALLRTLIKVIDKQNSRLIDLHGCNIAVRIPSSVHGFNFASSMLSANIKNADIRRSLKRTAEKPGYMGLASRPADKIALQPVNHAYNDERLLVREMLVQPGVAAKRRKSDFLNGNRND